MMWAGERWSGSSAGADHARAAPTVSNRSHQFATQSIAGVVLRRSHRCVYVRGHKQLWNATRPAVRRRGGPSRLSSIHTARQVRTPASHLTQPPGQPGDNGERIACGVGVTSAKTCTICRVCAHRIAAASTRRQCAQPARSGRSSRRRAPRRREGGLRRTPRPCPLVLTAERGREPTPAGRTRGETCRTRATSRGRHACAVSSCADVNQHPTETPAATWS